jgi:lipoprotein-releasing system permease protein
VPAPGFEWFVAWRHLRGDAGGRGHRGLVLGLVTLAVGLGWLALAQWGPRWIADLYRPLYIDLKTAGVIATALGGLLTVCGALFTYFTVFTAISIIGVFIGTSAPIVALSVMSGFETDLKSKIRATKADVVIEAAGDRPFTDWQAVQDKIASVQGVVASMAYIESEVIVKHASNPAGMGIVLRGIDPLRAKRVLDLERKMKEGKVEYLLHPDEIPPDDTADLMPFPELGDKKADLDARAGATARGKGAGGADAKHAGAPGAGDAGAKHTGGKGAGDAGLEGVRPLPASPKGAAHGDVVPGILLGDELYARTLHVFVGSDVDVACPMCGVGPTGPMPKLKSFRVAGHFYTGLYEFDSKLAYVSLADAQKFLGMQGEVTGIEIRTEDPDRARDVAAAIEARIGPGFEVRSWEELNRSLFTALKLEKIAMFVVLTFIALVASFSIVSTLIMLVTEKGREVAILKSMGAGNGAILRVFFAEGLYIGLVGLVLGLVFGIAGCLLISRYGLPINPDVYYIQKLPIVMRAGEIASVTLAALVLCCLATLYPALLAVRMRPVEGLRYE